jgi:hypothetical protein
LHAQGSLPHRQPYSTKVSEWQSEQA